MEKLDIFGLQVLSDEAVEANLEKLANEVQACPRFNNCLSKPSGYDNILEQCIKHYCLCEDFN
jgi:hypothetical protein